MTTPTRIYMHLVPAENDWATGPYNIRKWSIYPFEGATEYRAVEGDSDRKGCAVKITDTMVEAAWADFEGRPVRVNSWYEKADFRSAIEAALTAAPASAEPVRWQAKYHDDTVWLDIPEYRADELRASGKCNVRPLYAGPEVTP